MGKGVPPWFVLSSLALLSSNPPRSPVASRGTQGASPPRRHGQGYRGISPSPKSTDRHRVTDCTQTANTNNCQFVPAGSDNTTAVACQPVTPIGDEAEMMMPGSAGTTAKPPPEIRPLGQVACTFLVGVVSLALKAAVVLELTSIVLPGGPCGPAGPIGPAGPATPAGPAGPAGPCSPSWPCVPGVPGGPSSPLAPSLPLEPAGPLAPAMPTGPIGPLAPDNPVDPGVPLAPD